MNASACFPWPSCTWSIHNLVIQIGEDVACSCFFLFHISYKEENWLIEEIALLYTHPSIDKTEAEPATGLGNMGIRVESIHKFLWGFLSSGHWLSTSCTRALSMCSSDSAVGHGLLGTLPLPLESSILGLQPQTELCLLPTGPSEASVHEWNSDQISRANFRLQ